MRPFWATWGAKAVIKVCNPMIRFKNRYGAYPSNKENERKPSKTQGKPKDN